MPNLFQTHCYIFSQQKLSGTQPHVQTLRIPLPILKFPTSTLTFHLRPSSWSLRQEDDIPRVVLVAWIWRVNTLASSCLRGYLSTLILSATVPAETEPHSPSGATCSITHPLLASFSPISLPTSRAVLSGKISQLDTALKAWSRHRLLAKPRLRQLHYYFLKNMLSF